MTKSELDGICQELRDHQRKRATFMKSRIMLENRLTAIIAIQCFGYSAKDKEKDRKKKIKQAQELIKRLHKNPKEPHPERAIVEAHMHAIKPLNDGVKEFEKTMVQLARQLPVCPWIDLPEQRGFAELNLAIIVGEAGNLDNFKTQWKLIKYFGCAPHTYEGKTQMGSTWRQPNRFYCGSLPADEWTKFKYPPRRRSVAYNVGKPLMMNNKDGPYRTYYLKMKARIKAKNPDYRPGRCDRHGQLCCTKLLLENLWKEWRKRR